MKGVNIMTHFRRLLIIIPLPITFLLTMTLVPFYQPATSHAQVLTTKVTSYTIDTTDDKENSPTVNAPTPLNEVTNSAPVTVKYIDTHGQKIQPDTVFYGTIGDYFMVSTPLIQGYLYETTYDGTMGIHSDTKQTITLIYKKIKETPPQGNYIPYNQYITVTSSNYNTWRNFSWRMKFPAKSIRQQTFLAKGKYNHRNGSTYLSLYDKKGQWYGYINQRATKVGNGPQGAFIKDGRTVTIKRRNYTLWQNFKWSPRSNTTKVMKKNYTARGKYQHYNGSTYYSLYDAKGRWQGYLNSKATQ